MRNDGAGCVHRVRGSEGCLVPGTWLRWRGRIVGAPSGVVRGNAGDRLGTSTLSQ